MAPKQTVVRNARVSQLPGNVLYNIARLYVELFHADEDASIIPVLTSFRDLFSRIIPHLYRHIHITNTRQPITLSWAQPEHVALIRSITLHPCRHARAGHHLRLPDKSMCHAGAEVKEEEPSDLEMNWMLHLAAYKGARRTPIERIDCYKVVGVPQTAWATSFFRPRLFVYHPTELSCDIFREFRKLGFTSSMDPQNVKGFMDLIRKGVADEYELDIWGIVDESVGRPNPAAADKGKREREKRKDDRKDFVWLGISLWLSHVFETSKDEEWVAKADAAGALPIAISCATRPFLFSSRVGEQPLRRIQHIFELKSEGFLIGPKEEWDYLAAVTIQGLISKVVRELGYEWSASQ